MKSHNTTCRICHIPITLALDESCPQEWLDKLIPLAVCNRCHDLLVEKTRSSESIQNACERLLLLPKHKKNRDKDIEEIRRALENATKRYAKVIAEYHRKQNYVWEPDFVQQLLDQPGKWYRILELYRKMVRQLYRETATQTA